MHFIKFAWMVFYFKCEYTLTSYLYFQHIDINSSQQTFLREGKSIGSC